MNFNGIASGVARHIYASDLSFNLKVDNALRFIRVSLLKEGEDKGFWAVEFSIYEDTTYAEVFVNYELRSQCELISSEKMDLIDLVVLKLDEVYFAEKDNEFDFSAYFQNNVTW